MQGFVYLLWSILWRADSCCRLFV